jgi:hypothetical protein
MRKHDEEAYDRVMDESQAEAIAQEYGEIEYPPDFPRGWIWGVYTRDPRQPKVSLGQADKPEQARKRVEDELTEKEHAAFGIMIGPGGTELMCRRTATGLTWI